MGNTTNRQASIDSRRIALEREIAIRVPRFDTFVTEYSSNISTTGMFIVSDNPQPPGTSFSFEFSVADDWKLIRGKAQVVWTRYRDEGPERQPGMGVRFLEVDAQSRRLIRWIVEKHIREGGKPFELDELRTVIDQALEEVLDHDEVIDAEPAAAAPPPSQRRPARPRASVRNAAAARVKRRDDRKVMPLLVTAAAVVVIVGLLFWLTEWLPDNKSSTQMATTETESAGGAGEEGVAGEQGGSENQAEADGGGSTESGAEATESSDSAPAVSPGPGENQLPAPEAAVAETLGFETPEQAENEAAEAPAPPPMGSAYKTVLNSVTGWADAWSDQDVSRYLEAYVDGYSPGGVSHRQWAAQRRERLGAPRFIKVSIAGLEMERIEDDLVRATFSQSYRSDRFSDTVQKTLDLRWEDGRWKIARERSS